MKWIEEAGLALMIALLLHAVWRQSKLQESLARKPAEEEANRNLPPPVVAPLGFSVAPWAP
jgi:hypothetical protein